MMMAARQNAIRISLAEWLFRMSEANVPYQARGLAVYAVLFKISTNEELATLSGMDSKGIADKTYNKWKRQLSDDGWVIVKTATVGRVTTIEVHPALGDTPVTFTDVTAKDTRKFYDRNNYGRTVEVTNEQPSPIVTSTAQSSLSRPNAAPSVKVTEVSRTRIETPSGLVITPVEVKEESSPTPVEQAPVAAGRIDSNALFERLSNAANGSLYPLSLNLQVVSEPIGWLQQGADLDLDVLPVISAMGHKAKKRSIMSWSYFSRAVIDAMDRRKRRLPAAKGIHRPWQESTAPNNLEAAYAPLWAEEDAK